MPHEIQTIVVEHNIYTCDWCGAPIDADEFDPTPRPCSGCGRYGCDEHARAMREREVESFPDGRYCDECWVIGEPFRVAIKDLESSIAWHLEAWHQKAKAAVRVEGE